MIASKNITLFINLESNRFFAVVNFYKNIFILHLLFNVGIKVKILNKFSKNLFTSYLFLPVDNVINKLL